MEESYGTVEGFYAYHTARNRDVGDYDEGQVAGALLVASEWLDGAFRDRLTGYKTGASAQVRDWPRTGITDADGYAVPYQTVPYQIERATYEAALRVVQSPDALAADVKSNKYKSVTIEGAISVDYADAGAAAVQLQMPVLGAILSSLFGNSGGSSPMSSRAVRA